MSAVTHHRHASAVLRRRLRFRLFILWKAGGNYLAKWILPSDIEE
ncbi:Uncharacterized protein ChrSV_4642 [Chromobacterium vaccinii]|nr:Uncharacterized protein ChrSW_4642 [Chromobacterium vaccinii]QND92098.1 Uncharacterized protein ChrSV_4642 [Chromobacterium vaccinii]